MSVWMLGRLLGNVTVSLQYRHREVNPVTLLDIMGRATRVTMRVMVMRRMVNVELG
jgi:hypothetical protein